MCAACAFIPPGGNQQEAPLESRGAEPRPSSCFFFFSGPIPSVSTASLLSSVTVFSYLPPLACEIEHHTGSFTQPVCSAGPRPVGSGRGSVFEQNLAARQNVPSRLRIFFLYPGLVFVRVNIVISNLWNPFSQFRRNPVVLPGDQERSNLKKLIFCDPN